MHHQQKTAFITGASSGIGAAFARRLAAEGYHLVLIARRENRLLKLAAELRPKTTSEIIVADLSSSEDIKKVEGRIIEYESLTMLVNNAGFVMGGAFATNDPDEIMNMIYLHILASVRLSRAALPGMVAKNQGAIINVSSISAFNPVKGNVTYGSTKAFLNFFSKSLQDDLRGTDIQIQALCPGYTHTELTDFRNPDQVPKVMPKMSAEKVVEASLNALDKRNQVIHIPHFQNRLLATYHSIRARFSILHKFQAHVRKVRNWLALVLKLFVPGLKLIYISSCWRIFFTIHTEF